MIQESHALLEQVASYRSQQWASYSPQTAGD